MAFTTTLQPVTTNSLPPVTNTKVDASLLSMLVLSLYAAQKSKKAMRKMKRKFMWTAFTLKMKSLFSGKATSDQTLIYILIGAVILALLIVSPVAALIVLLTVLILYLLGVLKF